MDSLLRRWVPAALVVMALGCTRVVDLEVAEGPVRLVIEGRIELIAGDAVGRQRVRLSTTDGFATSGLPPAATGESFALQSIAGWN